MEGPRTRVGQPKMNYWKLHELHKNEAQNVHPENLEILKAPEMHFKSISKCVCVWGGGGGGSIFVGLDHSGCI